MDVTEPILPRTLSKCIQNSERQPLLREKNQIAISIAHAISKSRERYNKPIIDIYSMHKASQAFCNRKQSPECSTSTETDSDEEKSEALSRKKHQQSYLTNQFRYVEHASESRNACSMESMGNIQSEATYITSTSSRFSMKRLAKETSPVLLFGSEQSSGLEGARYEFKQLCRLSSPVILTYILEYLPCVISVLLVGHIPSSRRREYLDGVSLSSMFMNLSAIPFGLGLATAMDTLCSRAHGARKTHRLGIYLQTGMFLLGLVLIPVMIVNYYTTFWLLCLRQPLIVAELAGDFSRILLPSLPCLYMYELMKKLLQAQHIVAPMVYIAMLSNVAHIVMGLYWTQCTNWGYTGAAIARTLSTMLLPLCLIPYFMYFPQKYRCWWSGWNLTEAKNQVRPFLELGIPGMLMILMEWWSFEVMAISVGLLPNSILAISVHSVLVNISSLTYNVFFGISVACNVRVGNCLGANEPERARSIALIAMAFSLAISALLAIILLIARAYVPMIFINDAKTVMLTSHAILVLLPFQLCDALSAVIQGIFRAIGQNYFGAKLNFVVYFMLGIPSGIYLAFRLSYGVEGLWIGLTLGLAVGALLATIQLFRMDWLALKDVSRM